MCGLPLNGNLLSHHYLVYKFYLWSLSPSLLPSHSLSLSLPPSLYLSPLLSLSISLPPSLYLSPSISFSQVPYSTDLKGFGVDLSDTIPIKVVSVVTGGPAENVGLCPGLEVVGIGGHWLTGDVAPSQIAASTIEHHTQCQSPLEFIVRRESSETFCLRSNEGSTLGLQLKGNQPVVINRVENGKRLTPFKQYYFI